jgi:hypothetical protein
MKVIKWQIWKNVLYRDRTSFKFWSAKIPGTGDKSLPKGDPIKKWRKIIVLRPIGNLETVFSVGFNDILGRSKVSSATRKIKDGLFGMRMGPDDCQFFVASNTGEVKLEFVEYSDIGDESWSKLPLY